MVVERELEVERRIGRDEWLQRALEECHRKVPPGSARDAACKHLNRPLAQWLVSLVCPDESKAVQSFCSSSGTEIKRAQCRQTQLSLSLCLCYLQQP